MSVFGKDEVAMRKYASSMPLPEFSDTPFNETKPIDQCKVAIVHHGRIASYGYAGFRNW